MSELVLTIIGRDRAGIVASLADVVRFHDGNWKRSELAEIAGTFAGVVVVEVGDDRVDELLANLLVLREQGLHVTAQPIEQPMASPEAIDVHVRLTGDDQPGVVHEISTRFGEHGISILRLGTVTDLSRDDGGKQFEFTARLAVPVAVDVDAVLDSIGDLATSLGITLHVEDLTDTPTPSSGLGFDCPGDLKSDQKMGLREEGAHS
ncbi:MAG TPA: ACT domain-containing protein [Ilumatobacter sp.]|nr:ACT domain-containing protein [Ilumatobacter sp.]